MAEREIITREKRLYSATLCGSVESLNEIMQEDALTLSRVSVTCFDETLLHVAAMLGHFDFAKALVDYKPDLVNRLDSSGHSPLHLASANGYVDIVRFLVTRNSDMCLICDEDSRTPLHLAVMNGSIDVIIELVQARPEATLFISDQGETILHLCVKYNRLEALKSLLEYSNRVEDDLNVKDGRGNTILHMATALKHMQTIKYLVGRNEMWVNAVNDKGCTALDIIELMPTDMKTMEIKELLISAGASGSKGAIQMPSSARTIVGVDKYEIYPNAQLATAATEKVECLPASQCCQVKHLKKNPSIIKRTKYLMEQQPWVEKKADSLMVAASVIAAMAYQAGFSPPGGVFQEDIERPRGNVTLRYEAGTSILSSYYPDLYRNYWIFNTIAFIAALSIIFLFVSGLSLKRRLFMWVLMAAMWATVSSMAVTYIMAIQAITPGSEGFEKQWFSVVEIIKATLLTWLGVISTALFFFAYRLIVWARLKIKKYRNKRVSRDAHEDKVEV